MNFSELRLPPFAKVQPYLITAVFVVVAIFAARWLWNHYEREPWTRDGRVRADYVQIAPDVGGFVTSVHVRDNQHVRKGDTLFVIDQARYRLAVDEAREKVASQQAQLDQAERDSRRNVALGNLASSEQREQSAAKLEELQAALQAAKTGLDLARLNLARTVVKATVNGIVTNLNLRPGAYYSPGKPVLTLIDSDSFYIVGYFEETKLPRIHIGNKVRVWLMGQPGMIKGHVQSITRGIEDRERAPDADLLPNINPTFNWVRLAQRIPVRIAIDRKPDDILLVMGRTATVEVMPGTAPDKSARQ